MIADPQHPPLFCKEHEDDPVYDSKDLLVVGPAGFVVTLQPFDKASVKKSIAEFFDCPDNILPEPNFATFA
jgi:hypothetical protein